MHSKAREEMRNIWDRKQRVHVKIKEHYITHNVAKPILYNYEHNVTIKVNSYFHCPGRWSTSKSSV